MPVATLLSYGAAQHLSPGLQIAVAALGGVIALAAHGSKLAIRTAVTPSPEPFSNIALSLAEDVAAVSLTWFATRHPIIAGVIVSVCLVLAILAIRYLVRALSAIIQQTRAVRRPVRQFDLIAGTMRYFSVDFNGPLTIAQESSRLHGPPCPQRHKVLRYVC